MAKNMLNVMFIGAAKRMSLLERFQAAASIEGITVNMYSVELTRRVPIAVMAEIIEGPSFGEVASEDFLLDVARRLKIDVIIPNIDAATVVLAKLKHQLSEFGIWAVASNYELCVTMYDKGKADLWFRDNEIPVPDRNGYPRIVKMRLGSGSKDQFLANNDDELRAWLSRRKVEDYLSQLYIQGQEFTVDAYVARSGHLLGSLSRKRIAVSDGEVDVSETFRHQEILGLTARILSVKGWEGAITLQFIDGVQGPVLIEINPRFAGGVTHSIHCGLDMPRWILRERMELPVQPAPDWPDGSFMTRCRRDIFL